MKKILACCLLFLTFSCDDGDLTLDAIDFTSTASVSACNTNAGVTLLFKINSAEVLILEIPATLIVNTVTDADTPRTADLSTGSANAFYRGFNTTITSSYFCDELPSSSISVTLEYTANNGTIEVVTTALTDTDGTVTSYNHVITLINVDFSNANGESVQYESLDYGSFSTSP